MPAKVTFKKKQTQKSGKFIHEPLFCVDVEDAPFLKASIELTFLFPKKVVKPTD